VVNKFINNQVERKISWIYAVSLEWVVCASYRLL
jgi:hypothetical protein